MNIVLLKGLIIAGGAAGIGVPSIYYGYPYISNLISPEIKGEGQESTGGQSGQVKINQNGEDGTGQEKVSTDSAVKSPQTEGSSTIGGGNNSPTDPQNKASENSESTRQGEQNSLSTGEGGDARGGSETSSTGETKTQENSRQEGETGKQQ